MRHRPGGRAHRLVSAWLFIGPALLYFSVFVLYPIVATIYNSLTQTLTTSGSAQTRFVGLKNYALLLSDAIYLKALANTTLWALIGPILEISLALVLALQRMRAQDLMATMPVKDHVAATSVGIVEGTLLLDLAYEEDSRAEVDMNVVKTGDGRFIEVQGTAEAAPFSRDALLELLDLADAGIRQLTELQREIVGSMLHRA